MKRNNYKIYLLIGLIAVITGLSMAFAAFTTSLNISGTATISSDWEIIWTDMQAVSAEKYAEAGELSIVDDGTNVVGSLGTLNAPGDKLVGTWYVTNNGEINAGTTKVTVASLSCAPTSTGGATAAEATQVCKDLDFTIEVEDWGTITNGGGPFDLDAGDSKLVTMTLIYKSSVSTPLSGKVEVTIKQMPIFEFEQKGGDSSSGGDTKDDGNDYEFEQAGEVIIGDEIFYTLTSDDDTVTLIAKNGLVVGDMYKANGTYNGFYSDAYGGYNITSEGVGGYIMEDTDINGVVAFSETNYWASTVTKYPSDVLGPDSIIQDYLYVYKTKFGQLYHVDATNIEVTIPSLDDVISLVDDSTPMFLGNRSYWTKTAADSENIYAVVSGYGRYPKIEKYSYSTNNYLCICPLVTIPKATLKNIANLDDF